MYVVTLRDTVENLDFGRCVRQHDDPPFGKFFPCCPQKRLIVFRHPFELIRVPDLQDDGSSPAPVAASLPCILKSIQMVQEIGVEGNDYHRRAVQDVGGKDVVKTHGCTPNGTIAS